MKQLQPSPYDVGIQGQSHAQRQTRWHARLAVCACVYYVASAVTLPFANKLWVGEAPILALLQLPKSFLKSVIHDALLYAVHSLGWSRGSASPDYGMTHPWAMIGMLTIPALLVACVIFVSQSDRKRTPVLVAVVTCAAIDTIVTLWFDSSFSLKLYNARYL